MVEFGGLPREHRVSVKLQFAIWAAVAATSYLVIAQACGGVVGALVVAGAFAIAACVLIFICILSACSLAIVRGAELLAGAIRRLIASMGLHRGAMPADKCIAELAVSNRRAWTACALAWTIQRRAIAAVRSHLGVCAAVLTPRLVATPRLPASLSAA